MQEIKIQFDIDTKTVTKIEGTKDIDPLTIAQIMTGVTMRSLAMMKVKEEKIIIPKNKIIVSDNGSK